MEDSHVYQGVLVESCLLGGEEEKIIVVSH